MAKNCEVFDEIVKIVDENMAKNGKKL